MVVAPVAALAILVVAWGGLVPPRWTEVHVSEEFITMAGAVYSFAVLGLFGAPFLFAVGDMNPTVIRKNINWLVGAGGAGLLLATIAASNFDESAGRWGGYLWEASRALPTISGRSVVFLALTPIGTAVFGFLGVEIAERCGKRTAYFWIGSFLAWFSTVLANRVAFHRYYEPPILVFLILWAVLMLEHDDLRRPVKLRFLYATAAAQLTITLGTAHFRTLIAAN